MKNTSCLLSLLATSLVIPTLIASDAPILIDLGSGAGNAKGNYNLINGKGLTGLDSIKNILGTYPLVDQKGSPAGTVIVRSGELSNWGDAMSDASWTGSKPAALSGIPASAIDDGLFIGNRSGITPTVSFAFSGLPKFQDYSVIFYSARGAQGIGPTKISVVTGKDKGNGATISNSFENSSEIGTFTAQSSGKGFLTLDYTVPVKGKNSLGALNFMSLTPISGTSAISTSDPSVGALLSLGDVTVILKNQNITSKK
ncbi:hypothetical protein [Rubritalea sp.]|uniref:hypothetical protein n=1 Tax=Rubritalea sp. TaxID=2109375 RepID=UPI003EFAF8CA